MDTKDVIFFCLLEKSVKDCKDGHENYALFTLINSVY